MATVSQLKLQLSRPVKYINGEASLPTPSLTPSSTGVVITPGPQVEGTDLGIIKVEGGKYVLDMDDFEPDFGTF